MGNESESQRGQGDTLVWGANIFKHGWAGRISGNAIMGDASLHRMMAQPSGTLQRAEEYKHSLGPRWPGDLSEILTAGRANRDSHLPFRLNLGQHRWTLGRGHPSKSIPGVQHGSALVSQLRKNPSIYATLSFRNLSSRSTALCLTHGNTTSLQTQKRY